MTWTGTDPRVWAAQTKQRMMATLRVAADDLHAEMVRTIPNGGNLPVKTGNLARSLVAQVGTPVRTAPPNSKFAGFDLGPVLLNWQPGETLYLGFQANYARRQNYGFVGTDSLGRTYNQAGRAFVEQAAAKWPFILENAAAKVASGRVTA